MSFIFLLDLSFACSNIYSLAENFLHGMQELGVPIVSEPNNGAGYGTFIAPSSLSADNQSRADSRVAYADSAIDRANLHIVTQQMVERILFDQDNSNTLGIDTTALPASYRATGVEVSFVDSIHGIDTGDFC